MKNISCKKGSHICLTISSEVFFPLVWICQDTVEKLRRSVSPQSNNEDMCIMSIYNHLRQISLVPNVYSFQESFNPKMSVYLQDITVLSL